MEVIGEKQMGIYAVLMGSTSANLNSLVAPDEHLVALKSGFISEV
jgi:hypothetical protein